MKPIILSIETSCDETSASIIENGKVLNNIIASQTIHELYGGVVPELASRAHQLKIVEVVENALSESGIKKSELDGIAFTRGPGLMGALLVGVSFAKGLSLALRIPLIEVNHIEAHVLAHFIKPPFPDFPFLCLTVSGGHTQLVTVSSYDNMKIIGQTQDDAAGEAFDKVAKVLGLPYPGGQYVDKYAMNGDPNRYKFPDTEMPNLDFSFSGIKTAFLYFIRDNLKKDINFIEKNLPDICASIQYKIVDTLIKRLEKASLQTHIKQIAISGGVAANSSLRKAVSERQKSLNWRTFIPDFEYCTDNAAMIAIAAHIKFLKKDFSNLSVQPDPNLQICSKNI